MVKYNLFFVFYLVTGFVYAQDLVIHVPGPRSYSFREFYAHTNSFEEGPSGRNVRWDFRNYRTFPGSVTRFCEINDTPYKELFPQSNFMEVKGSDGYEEIKAYSIDKDVMLYNGDIMHRKGERISPHQQVVGDSFFRYPLYYGKTWTIDDKRVRVDFNVDGEGTIVTPDSLEYNALRVKLTMFSGIEPLQGNTQMSVSYRYDVFVWVIPEMPCSYVFRMVKHQKEYHKSDGTSSVKDDNEATYYKPLDRLSQGKNTNSLKLTAHEENTSELKVSLTLRTRENITLAMTDMSGKIVFHLSSLFDKNSVGTNGFTIPTSNLAPGTYIISAISETSEETIKWVKK